MTTAQPLTADIYERRVASLRGRSVVAVDYFVLMVGEEGTDVDEWDYGTWHEPTMGVWLTLDSGEVYAATWDSTFDYYGLELQVPTNDYLVRVNQPGGLGRISVTNHPLWAGIVSTPIESCRILWCDEEHGARSPIPDAIHLRTAMGQAWIAAGRSADYEPGGSFYLCTDDVFVVFDVDTAARAGLRGSSEDSS